MLEKFFVLYTILVSLRSFVFCYDSNQAPCKNIDEVRYVCMPFCKNTCKNYNNPHTICRMKCVPGCFCKPGLVKRESDGKCILPKQCIHVSCPNEDEIEYICKPHCKNTCRNFKNPNAVCPAICTSGCFCRPGLLKRESDGKCVKPETCSHAPCEKETEVEYFCKPECKNTCRNFRNPAALCPTGCKSGCYCRPGLVKRETDGKCVPPYQCSHVPCQNENEIEYFCKPFCKNTCQNYKNPNAVCPAICIGGCFCKPGLVKRESDGQCLPQEQCVTVQCPLNEVYSECVIPCNDCNAKGNCKFFVCNKGCDCKKGYYRNHAGRCVPEVQCPVNCPLNEKFSECVIPCNDCKTRGRCKMTVCNKGCDCVKGYYRDHTQKCIPQQQCPNFCRADEEYYNCAPICNTCKNHNKRNVACIQICRTGCFCRRGLLLREDGKCVLPEQCPPHGSIHPVKTLQLYDRDIFSEPSYRRLNHHSVKYDSAADWLHPSSVKNVSPQYNSDDSKGKNPGSHLLPNVTEKFSSERDLPSRTHLLPKHTCRRNEKYYTCAPICNTCGNHGRTAVACSKICLEGCFCLEGFLKRHDGNCVPPEECQVANLKNFDPWSADDITNPSGRDYYDTVHSEDDSL